MKRLTQLANFSWQFVKAVLFLVVFCSFTGCISIEEYQKALLNDEEMQLGDRPLEIFESDFQSYREGAVGGNDGNKGGGCSCN